MTLFCRMGPSVHVLRSCVQGSLPGPGAWVGTAQPEAGPCPVDTPPSAPSFCLILLHRMPRGRVLTGVSGARARPSGPGVGAISDLFAIVRTAPGTQQGIGCGGR